MGFLPRRGPLAKALNSAGFELAADKIITNAIQLLASIVLTINTGRCLVSAGFSYTGATDGAAYRDFEWSVYIDGVLRKTGAGSSAYAGGVVIGAGGVSFWVDGLTAGPHTFELKGFCPQGGSGQTIVLRAASVPANEFLSFNVVELM